MLKYIKIFVEQSWLLIVSAFCFGLLIAVTNAAWAPRIEQNRIEKLNRLMTGLIPQAASFEKQADPVTIDLGKGRTATSDIYKAINENGDLIGFSFIAQGSGFADKILLVLATDQTLENVAGFDVLASNETPGFGDQIKFDYFRDQFKNAPAANLELVKTGDPKKIDNQIVAITGATVSSDAVVAIINNNIKQIKANLNKKGLIPNGN